jgi:hypothetical protein
MRRISHKNHASASALVMVMVIISASLLMLAASLSWMSNNKTLTARYNQYTRSTAAAEAATEKIIVAINNDYKLYGQTYVINNLAKYRSMVPSGTENKFWRDFRFTDETGHPGRTQIEYIAGTNLTTISAQYRGLLGFPSTYRIIGRAQQMNSTINVKGAVEQQVQVALIPLYQFAMFYNLDYECTALPLMTVNGPVHCNGDMYLTPWTGLTFNNDLTCTKQILRTAKPGNAAAGTGPVTYKGAHDGGVSTLTLPIGTNNSIQAVRQVVEVPPSTEDPDSSLGQQRLYNKAEMLILVSNSVIYACSGRGSKTPGVPLLTDVTQFVRTNVSFYNAREKKTVLCTEIDIQKLAQWNAVNFLLRPVLPYGDLRVIYVADFRTMNLNTYQPGIRLVNGQTLLPQGLTIASPQPVYIKGDYNCPNSWHLGTTNTTATAPASIISDAITILSSAWNDSAGAGQLKDRVANDTTVNAAFVAGIVQTTPTMGYSGGVENFPRFLEEWSSRTSTYNGSMVVMYESKFATNKWLKIGDYYNPPVRNWSFDTNFRDPAKLPPATPAAAALIRGKWNLIASK